MAKKSCFAYQNGGCRVLNDCEYEKKGKICSFFKTESEINIRTSECNKRLVGFGYALRKPYRVKK